MSHRAFDELAQMRSRLAALEAELAALRAGRVVDFAELHDLRNTRDTVAAQIAAKEEAMAR